MSKLKDSMKAVYETLLKRYNQVHIPPSTKHTIDGNVCAYRGDDSNKCSIGYLLKDEVYRRKFEELDVLTLLDRFPYIITSLQSQGMYPTEQSEFSKMNEFLMDVQIWHDFWYITHFQDHFAVNQSLSRLATKWQIKSWMN